MDLYSQLQTLNQEDDRIKEDEFDKLNKMSAGMTEDTMIGMMRKMNNLNSAVRRLATVIENTD